jgi:hypothetical protein
LTEGALLGAFGTVHFLSEESGFHSVADPFFASSSNRAFFVETIPRCEKLSPAVYGVDLACNPFKTSSQLVQVDAEAFQEIQ